MTSRSRALGLAFAAGLLIGSIPAQGADKKASAASKGQEAKVDTKASKVAWTGKKVTGSHNGAVNIKEGSLWIANESLTGGRVVIDMASISNQDLEGDANGNLVGHLKSDDFFGVEKYPTATFEIDSVKPIETPKGQATHDIAGRLTVKGKTEPLTFPARIDVEKGKLTAIADGVKVDRTKYGIRYGSGKFFQGLGDKVIYDDFTIDLKVVANR